ncbi:hypothetical protein F2P56_026758, partial [Juglans regia]
GIATQCKCSFSVYIVFFFSSQFLRRFGAAADVFLWRNKKISASVLGGATAIWVFFELLEYHLLTLVCHVLILALAILFLWSNAHTFINKTPPRIPEVHLPEEPFLQVAAALRIEINRGFVVLRDIMTGRDLKKFLIVRILCFFEESLHSILM